MSCAQSSMRRTLLALPLILAVSCRPGVRRAADAADNSARWQAATTDTYELTVTDVAEMRHLVQEMTQLTAVTIGNLDAAAARYREATQLYQQAAQQYAEAAQNYEAAATRFRQVAVFVILAASSQWFAGGVCGPNVSTRAYRQVLKRQGVNLAGKDVDHIISRAHGGPNRPWNYLPLEASINRSLREGGLGWKLMNFPLPTLRALVMQGVELLAC